MFISSLAVTLTSFVEDMPPPPKTALPPPPVGLPIDGYIMVAMVVGLIIGVLYTLRLQNTKRTN